MAIEWRCTLCGQCCKTYVPMIIPDDIHRIHDSLGHPLSYFLSFYRPTDFSEAIDDDSLGLFFQTRFGLLSLCLSRGEIPNGEVGCVFLKNNLCSIHLVRPFICRSYPFQPVSAEDIDGPFRLKDAPCFDRHATDEVVDENPIRQNYRLFREREGEYREQIKEWNDNTESGKKEIEDFLSFVGLQWS